MNVIDLCERGLVPDFAARAGMRSLMRRRLVDEANHDGEVRSQRFNRFLDQLRASPIAVETRAANQQHYEVPAEFFHLHLGPRLKYSCCLYPTGTETLAQAGEAMLALYAERAGLRDGMRILDLGCGWGSLSLWLAEKYPNSRIVGLSNSHGQREFIEQQRLAPGERGFSNLQHPHRQHRRLRLPFWRIRRRGRRSSIARHVDRDVRAHEELRPAAGQDRALAQAGGPAVRAYLRAQAAGLSLRGAGAERLDEPVLLHRRHHALEKNLLLELLQDDLLPPTAMVGRRPALRENLQSLARRHGCREARRSCRRCFPRLRLWSEDPRRRCGSSAGACSTWPWRNCSATLGATNGA